MTKQLQIVSRAIFIAKQLRVSTVSMVSLKKKLSGLNVCWGGLHSESDCCIVATLVLHVGQHLILVSGTQTLVLQSRNS